MQRDDATLLDIAEAARLIQVFTSDVDRDAFSADPKTKSATLYQLLDINCLLSAKPLNGCLVTFAKNRRISHGLSWRVCATI